jgi:hypothetical protein
MWDYDGYLSKAKLFISRAESYSDDGFALWMLLGLECLLRAPLAKIHPSLLAEPTGTSLLHANGIDAPGDPKTVSLVTVLKRLETVVPGFTAVKDDCERLINLRNGELHSSATVLADIKTSDWLGKYYEVIKVVLDHIGVPVSDLLAPGIETQASQYAQANRAKTENSVRERMEKAGATLANLTAEEVILRAGSVLSQAIVLGSFKLGTCPVCAERAIFQTTEVRSTLTRYDDEEGLIDRDVVSIVHRVRCVVCELELNGVHEVEAAGIKSELVERVSESIADRYGENFIEADYGND